jgi:hypothetical protein
LDQARQSANDLFAEQDYVQRREHVNDPVNMIIEFLASGLASAFGKKNPSLPMLFPRPITFAYRGNLRQ